MNKILENKKVIFLDVGYTLDAPASGDWMRLANAVFPLKKRYLWMTELPILRVRQR